MIRSNKIIMVGALLGALAVCTGAMGAHALEKHLIGDYQSYYEKAVFYQFVHSFLLIFIGILSEKINGLKWAAILAFTGILFFSGSLYLFSLQEIVDLGGVKKVLGPITPVGGLCFIGAWLIVAVKALRQKKE